MLSIVHYQASTYYPPSVTEKKLEKVAQKLVLFAFNFLTTNAYCMYGSYGRPVPVMNKIFFYVCTRMSEILHRNIQHTYTMDYLDQLAAFRHHAQLEDYLRISNITNIAFSLFEVAVFD